MIKVNIEGETRLCDVHPDAVFDEATHVIVKTNADSLEAPPKVVFAVTEGWDAYISTLAINAALRAEGYEGPKRFKSGLILK